MAKKIDARQSREKKDNIAAGVKGGNLLPALAFAAVSVYLAIFILTPFLASNNLFNYDMAGMYFSSWYTAHYLFPRPIGWNPYFFLGYAQNQFYGPLFPYLVSILSVAMPTEAAFKAVLTLVILLMPISFYYFARSFGFPKNNSAAVMLLMFALLFALPWKSYGGDMYSTFGTGLVASALALPIFFFYFGAMRRNIDSGNFYLPGALLALVVLSHSLTSLAALFIPLGFMIATPSRKTLKFILLHIIVAFLLSSFWLVPALAKLGYSTVFQIGAIDNNAALLVISVVVLAALAYKRKNTFLPAGIFIATILFFSLIGNELHLPIHFYRFSLLIFLTVPLVAFAFIRWESTVLLGLVFIATFAVVLTGQGIHPEGYSTIHGKTVLPAGTQPRLLVEVPPPDEPSPSELQQSVPLTNSINSVRGVFVESSKNSKFVFDLEREIDPANVNWGVVTDDYKVDSLGKDAKKLVPAQMKLLGINSVFTSLPPLEGWKTIQKDIFKATMGNGAEQMQTVSYGLYKTGEYGIAEVLGFTPTVVSKDNWDQETTDWFLSDNVKDSVLVDEQAPGAKGKGNEKVVVLEQSPTMEYMKFGVDSTVDVPVLLKISYFPNWHAYSNGKELHIYRASPYFMLVYGHGEIELRYQQEWSDLLGYLLTVAGTAVLIWCAWNYFKTFPVFMYHR